MLAAPQGRPIDLSGAIMRQLGFRQSERSRWRRLVGAALPALLLAGVVATTAILVRHLPGAPGPAALAGPSFGQAMEGAGSGSTRRFGELLEQVLPARGLWPVAGEAEVEAGGEGDFIDLVAMAPWGSA